ncbi:YfbM family protein [Micromonospora robiginosa]|uniref:YfbM family protein n=1 Tax=Micromonospora robiginosa TaxID=2749844 RepID=A0A7L6B4E8_9ACTN|nr:YfbM family protein [Micromonospora ferruginea]QLQ36838.1 YfbM family protein [Micromonospora ferruginea]
MGMVLIGRRLSGPELSAAAADPTTVAPLLHGDDPLLDLDKSWHGLHYLLTGTAWDTDDGAGAAILGGEPIGDDVGYGPPRLLAPDAVRAVADGLDAVNEATLRARFDPDAMTDEGIYPAIWHDGDDEFDTYLWPSFVELRRFYRTAATQGEGVLLAVT